MKTAAEDTRRLYFYGYLPFSLTGQNSVFRFVCLDGTRTFVFVFVALCSLPFLATPPCWRVYEDTYYLPCCVFYFSRSPFLSVFLMIILFVLLVFVHCLLSVAACGVVDISCEYFMYQYGPDACVR